MAACQVRLYVQEDEASYNNGIPQHKQVGKTYFCERGQTSACGAGHSIAVGHWNFEQRKDVHGGRQ
jgi:hypothetical protein